MVVWACVPHGRLIGDCEVTQCVVLGQEHSHATGQSQRESHATGQYEQTKAIEMPDAQARDKRHDNPNDHAVMVPMSQPTGGWHVTSMTGRSRPLRPEHMAQDYRNQT